LTTPDGAGRLKLLMTRTTSIELRPGMPMLVVVIPILPL
jgi:hypothetical protein